MITKQKVFDRLEGFKLSNQQKEQVYNLITEVGSGGGNENSSEKPKLKIYLYSKDDTLIVRIDDIEYIIPSTKIANINSKELNDKYKNHTIHDIIFIFIPSLEQPNIAMELSPTGIERNGDLFVVMMKFEELSLEVGVAFIY